jgi:hypothetical protein
MRDSSKRQHSYALSIEQRIWGSLFETNLHIKPNAWQQIFKTDGAGLLRYVTFGNTSPIVAMCAEELKQSDVTDIIRVGTCGGLYKELKVGELILAVWAVRGEGTSSCYADLRLSAVASPTLLLLIEEIGEAVKESMDKGCSKKVLKTVGTVIRDITDILRSA